MHWGPGLRAPPGPRRTAADHPAARGTRPPQRAAPRMDDAPAVASGSISPARGCGIVGRRNRTLFSSASFFASTCLVMAASSPSSPLEAQVPMASGSRVSPLTWW